MLRAHTPKRETNAKGIETKRRDAQGGDSQMSPAHGGIKMSLSLIVSIPVSRQLTLLDCQIAWRRRNASLKERATPRSVLSGLIIYTGFPFCERCQQPRATARRLRKEKSQRRPLCGARNVICFAVVPSFVFVSAALSRASVCRGSAGRENSAFAVGCFRCRPRSLDCFLCWRSPHN